MHEIAEEVFDVRNEQIPPSVPFHTIPGFQDG